MNMGLGMILIEICDYNILTAEHLKKIARHPEVAVMSYDCLNLCGMCSLRPFAVVNGQRVFAASVEDCLAKIEQRVEEELKKLA
ncbi:MULTISPECIES: DUF1450 domain-containing protein [unclassified Sporolactobacillus]|uniref:DUF1450 domain-containing protein n=1 Tax=unclassified Sporolactobacillus TaxID=2628533 RepID=UPI00236861AA|nr:DUF1450 domain-containing protein [Sporolactobacillus sp. CQH2019]MDD9150101.1 DUF1450 domain-containing protein [Sporolactobacillus sp. CQH2019]